MSQYLLDCQCGNTVTVRPQQAGGSIRCDCGETLAVPDLRRLRQLPELKPTSLRTKKPWTPLRGTIFGIGFAVFLVAAGCFALFAYQNSRLDVIPPDMNLVKQFETDLSKMSPTQTWDIWAEIEQRTLYRFRVPLYQRDRARAVWLYNMMSVAGITGALGLIAALGSTFIGRSWQPIAAVTD